MVETFQKNAIAAGHDNIAGLTNIETITVNSHYFQPVDDLDNWSDGAGTLRGSDGVTVPQGFASTAWNAGLITRDQWYYLYSNILGGNRSGKVTIKTQRYNPGFYVYCNANLDIGDPPTLQSRINEYAPFIYRYSRLKILEEDLMYGDIYAKDASTGQASIDTTPALLTGFAANGLSSGTTPDHTSDNITVAFAGVYTFSFHISATATASTQFLFYIRVNAEEGNYGCEFTTNATPDAEQASMSGRLTLSANDIVTVYVQSDAGGGATLTPTQMQLELESVALS